MMTGFEPLLIVLAGLLDRVRGDGFHFFRRVVDKLLYGWIIAAIFQHPFDWLTPAIAVAFAFGASPGWGDSMGAILEKREIYADYDRNHFWQHGILRRNKWAAAVVRGALWGVPVALLGYFDPLLVWAIPVYTIAFVGSLVLAARLDSKQWEHAETIRGIMAGALIWLATVIL